jgi:hypothetical protein
MIPPIWLKDAEPAADGAVRPARPPSQPAIAVTMSAAIHVLVVRGSIGILRSSPIMETDPRRIGDIVGELAAPRHRF